MRLRFQYGWRCFVRWMADADPLVLAPGNVFSPAQSWPDFLRFNASQSQHQRLYDFLKTELRVAQPLAENRDRMKAM